MPCGDLRWQWVKIALVTPAGPGMRNGNRHTALRWAAFLRAAGHAAQVRARGAQLLDQRLRHASESK